jgi:hypothetical protein
MTSRTAIASFTCFFVLALLAPSQATAQVAGGTIQGTIVDGSGAVLPGTTVVVKNVGTGITTEVVTNDRGVYRAANLRPGVYDVSASLQGFTSGSRKGLELNVGSDVTIDLTLSPGGVAETVIVLSEAPAVDTSSPTLGAVVKEATIVELPLNGRDWTSLATLQPGISSIRTQAVNGVTSSRGNRGYGDELTITGHRPQENNYRIDGVSINDYSNGAPGSAGGVNLGADAIQEFSVLASNYTAEYGRTSGGVINAVTRSGANTVHGSAYEFLRHDKLDAINFINKENGQAKPPLRRNQFGASFGGPIVKNKMFAFADYEGIRRTQGVTSVANVLSPTARRGELAAGRVAVDPAVVPYLSFWPLPNGPLLGNGDTGVFATTLNQELKENFWTGRVDHKFSNVDSIFGTFMVDRATFGVPDPLNNTSFPNKTLRQLVAVEETHVFSGTFLNSFRVGVNRTTASVNISGPATNPVAGDLVLGSAPGRAAPIISVPGLTQAVAVGGNSFFDHAQNSYQVYDDAFLTKGNHALKFGFAFERVIYAELGLRRPNGLFNFGSLASFLTNTPTNFFGLDPTRAQRANVRSNIVAGYANDAWRVRRKLTLNLGLRYEMSTIPTEKQDRFLAVQDLFGGPVVNVKALFRTNPTLKNFEPRVGFAYDPRGNAKTAIRGGFGVYDALPLPWIFTPKIAQGTPFNVGTTVRNLPQGSFPKAAFNLIDFTRAAVDTIYVEQDPKRNYILNWNLTVQQQLAASWTATVAYVGSRGEHMAFATDDANIVMPVGDSPQGLLWPTPARSGSVINPNAGDIRATFWNGTSRYNALQLQVSRPLRHGYQAQGSYTFSSCVDDGSEASRGDQFQNGITTPMFFERAHRRGPCAFDLRHVLVLNALWSLPGSSRGVAGALLNNWQLGGIVNASTGAPFSVIIAGDPMGLNGVDVIGWPDVAKSPECATLTNPNDHLQYIKTQCFTAPNPLTRLGNAGRNIVRGPGLLSVDAAFYKNVPIGALGKGARAQVRLECFNLLNRANFAAPLANNAVFNQSGGAIASAGRITSTQTTARQVQIGLRLNW